MYRYFMGGSFSPANKDYDNGFGLGINVPSPFAHETEAEAMKDENFAYRFSGSKGNVVIKVYPSEDCKSAVDSNGRKCLSIWTTGEPFAEYDYDEFKELGGYIFTYREGEPLKGLPEGFPNAPVVEEGKEIEVTFNELFPDGVEKGYIDNESYIVREVVDTNTQKDNLIMIQPDPNKIINMKIVGKSGKGYAFKA